MRVRGTPPFDRGPIIKNIEAILKLEEDDERKLSSLHRVSHKVGWFVGTICFVIIQAVFVLFWLLWNAFAVWPFDPYPFPLLSAVLLSAVLALEAVFLASFVLIRQNSMDRQSERRNHLDLQINLLAEKEATSILRALSERAKHFKIDLSTDAESREMTEDTAVESIARDHRSSGAHQSTSVKPFYKRECAWVTRCGPRNRAPKGQALQNGRPL